MFSLKCHSSNVPVCVAGSTTVTQGMAGGRRVTPCWPRPHSAASQWRTGSWWWTVVRVYDGSASIGVCRRTAAPCGLWRTSVVSSVLWWPGCSSCMRSMSSWWSCCGPARVPDTSGATLCSSTASCSSPSRHIPKPCSQTRWAEHTQLCIRYLHLLACLSAEHTQLCIRYHNFICYLVYQAYTGWCWSCIINYDQHRQDQFTFNF